MDSFIRELLDSRECPAILVITKHGWRVQLLGTGYEIRHIPTEKAEWLAKCLGCFGPDLLETQRTAEPTPAKLNADYVDWLDDHRGYCVFTTKHTLNHNYDLRRCHLSVNETRKLWTQ